MTQKYNRNRNHTNYNNKNYHHRRCNSGTIISALNKIYQKGGLSYYTVNDMIEYVLKNPYMKNCSNTLFSLYNTYCSGLISSFSLSDHVWSVLKHA